MEQVFYELAYTMLSFVVVAGAAFSIYMIYAMAFCVYNLLKVFDKVVEKEEDAEDLQK